MDIEGSGETAQSHQSSHCPYTLSLEDDEGLLRLNQKSKSVSGNRSENFR